MSLPRQRTFAQTSGAILQAQRSPERSKIWLRELRPLTHQATIILSNRSDAWLQARDSVPHYATQ